MRALTLAIVGTSLLGGLATGAPRIVPGANHHIGNAGFIEAHGRAPTPSDPQVVQMHDHFAFIRKELAKKPATKPELQAQRDKLLGFLDEYLAKGTTPKNEHLPSRTPVFIDDDNTICAVGYLIERSTASRALPEKIAATHRYDVIEDIAKAMPEVGDWVASSGMTIDELASIQPGYIEPVVESWLAWEGGTAFDEPGYEVTDGERVTKGTFANGLMTGAWSVTNEDHVVGTATMKAGAGTWRSTYANGATLATGPMRRNMPDGAWKFFHASGNLAAEGNFHRGARDGAWRFYYDTAYKTPIARGRFSDASLVGRWSHFDDDGKKLATSTSETPSQWENRGFGHLLSITPGADGVRHEVHQGNVMGDHHRLDGFYKGNERLYVEGDRIWDAAGNKLEEVDGEWLAGSCHWSKKRIEIAQHTDITTLHGLLYRETPSCAEGKPVSAARAKTIEALIAPMRTVRAQSATFVKKLALGEETVADGLPPTQDQDGSEAADAVAEQIESDDSSSDLAVVLAANMTWYVEWPHVDGRFIQVFRTIAGYRTREL